MQTQVQRPPQTRPVRYYTTFRNTILTVLQERGWEAVQSDTDDWDFIWASVEWISERFDQSHVPDHKFVNHFRNFYILTRKDLMAKNIKAARRLLQKFGLTRLADEFAFVPPNFILPMEFGMITEHHRKQQGRVSYIVKPSCRAQGKGIFICTYPELSTWFKTEFQAKQTSGSDKEALYVVQQYLDDPLTVCGHKFDLRIYCLVESFQPLVAWVCREGFARFSLRPFVPTANMNDLEVHLTNVAIQKNSTNYDAEADGAKWSLFQLACHLETIYGREAIDAMFLGIERLIIHSLQAVANDMIRAMCTFEIYGFDVMLDSSLKAWLIEVNASPSLSADTREDSITKRRMLHDAINILGVDAAPPPPECTRMGCWNKIYSGTVPKFSQISDSTRFERELLAGCVSKNRASLGCASNRVHGLLGV
ncbi:Tubulin tyrosine ligase-like 2 [Giardia muris]|uniref:Tubulin--tyrosine ligase-like protein 9 n=1 Tax=Giardia muris TaxID=5742 RepID=A0A4Z1SYZ3_GIAMU|nr:Tubulin tyrosine ligase-like 2 [Giardia muris]|eukprot:TNJ30690.1 Tubulin tyrosine ligase-like 2 [Giardia muris]